MRRDYYIHSERIKRSLSISWSPQWFIGYIGWVFRQSKYFNSYQNILNVSFRYRIFLSFFFVYSPFFPSLLPISIECTQMHAFIHILGATGHQLVSFSPWQFGHVLITYLCFPRYVCYRGNVVDIEKRTIKKERPIT